jgi:phosphonate transport system ATP-binding protein
LSLQGAAKRFGSFEALQPVSLTIAPGERVAIVGPSGAGKTTLLRLLNTSLFPSAGSVRVLDSDPAALGPRDLRALRGRIGTIYQQLLLVPQVSVLQNVVAGRLAQTPLWKAVFSLVSKAEAERVHAVLERVGIGSKIYERVDRLSGGEQQRVAIARALYQQPDILIADEPVSSVDPGRSAEILELLAKAGHGRTLLISTHRLEATMPWISRVIGLREGKLLFDKSSATLTLDDLSRLYASDKGKNSPRGARPLSPALSSPAGAVFIGASNTPGEFMLPSIVPAFVSERPGVRVSLTLKDTLETTKDLLEGRLDLAFVGAREANPRLRFEDFADDEIILVASPFFRLPPGMLSATAVAGLARVERESGSGTRAVVEEYFSNMGAPLSQSAVALEVGSLVGLKAAVISGIGVAFASRMAVASELKAGLLRELAVDSMRIRRQIFAAWRADAELMPQAKSFLEIARRAWRSTLEERS